MLKVKLSKRFWFLCILALLGLIVYSTSDRYWYTENVLEDQERPRVNINNRYQHNVSVTSSDPTDILISSYMRSGSTFIGRIIGLRDDVFYFYEPLWKVKTLTYYRDPDTICAYSTMDCVNMTSVDLGEGNVFKKNWMSYKYRDEVRHTDASDFLLSIFTCQFDQFPYFVREHIHADINLAGSKWTTFVECRYDQGDISTCIKKMNSVCTQSKHHVTKVLRMSPKGWQHMLLLHPRLKVVHVFRDPRGVINSHLRTEFYSKYLQNTEDVRKDVKAHCRRVLEDIQALSEIKKQYPNRVLVLQYEDFSNQTEAKEKIKYIYRFLEMEYSEKYKNFAFSFLEKENHNAKETEQGNHPYLFRNQLDYSVLQFIDVYCSEVYSLLGYRQFKNEADFRNLSLSSIVSPLPFII